MTSKDRKQGHGSEWSVCELHVHTPCSIVQQYGGDTPAVWDKYVKVLESLPEDVKILGITDYYFTDGYERVIEAREKHGRLPNIVTVLPIFEFRIDTFGPSAVIGLVALLIIPLLLLAGVLTIVLAVTAALPATIGIFVMARFVWRCPLRALWPIYLGALSGLVAYVSSAVAISIAIGILRSPFTAIDFYGQLANPLWALAAHASDALHAFGHALIPLRQLMGLGFDGHELVSVKAAALAIFHLPGLIACGCAITYWIGHAVTDSRSRFAAYTTAALVALASLGLSFKVALSIVV
jgi:hypothetical protein